MTWSQRLILHVRHRTAARSAEWKQVATANRLFTSRDDSGAMLVSRAYGGLESWVESVQQRVLTDSQHCCVHRDFGCHRVLSTDFRSPGMAFEKARLLCRRRRCTPPGGYLCCTTRRLLTAWMWCFGQCWRELRRRSVALPNAGDSFNKSILRGQCCKTTSHFRSAAQESSGRTKLQQPHLLLLSF